MNLDAMPGQVQQRRGRVVLVLGVVVVLGTAGGIAWQKWIKDRVIARNFGVVEAGQVYRAGRLPPSMLSSVIRENNIRTVIDFGAFDLGSDEERDAREACAKEGAQRHELRMKGDGTGDPNNYVAALRLLNDPANHPVLVQCAAGAERTGACIILYRTVIQGRTISEVFPEAFEHHHDPRENWRMIAYLADWNDEIARSFADGAVIPYAGKKPGGAHKGEQSPVVPGPVEGE